jgi:hypothetical protein
VQKPFPLWVGGFGEQLVTRAGADGYHLQGGGPHVARYLSALRDNGFDPDQFNHQLFASGHLADTWDRAWDEVQEGLYYHRAFYEQRDWIATRRSPHFEAPAAERHAPRPRHASAGRHAR